MSGDPMLNLLRIVIESEDVRVREFTDKKGVHRVYREQAAVAWCCVKDSEELKPRPIHVPLDGVKFYPIGVYTLSRRSFYVDYGNFSKLAVIPRLVPMPTSWMCAGEYADGAPVSEKLDDIPF